jgi:hypothetical protein
VKPSAIADDAARQLLIPEHEKSAVQPDVQASAASYQLPWSPVGFTEARGLGGEIGEMAAHVGLVGSDLFSFRDPL